MRLRDSVVVVTGASRGVGRGVAVALGREGATVYITARSLKPSDGASVGGSLEETAAAIDDAGGKAIAVPCDHTDDENVRALFDRLGADHGRCDVLVNNVFATPGDTQKMFDTPFWEQPIGFWDTMHSVGLRSHYVASAFAAPWLIKAKGLVAHISSFGGASYQVNVAYGVGKAGVDRLARDMARDFKPHGVTAVSLYPGVVRTERVLAGEYPFSTEVSESPEFTGRAIAELALDKSRATKSGRVHVVAELAREYGFKDVDGSQPASLRELALAAKAKKKQAAELAAKETL